MNTEHDYKLFLERSSSSDDFILPTLEELNSNNIKIIHTTNDVVTRQMYGVIDGELDENKTRKFLTVCDKIFSIESAHYFNNDTSEIIVGNKIRYIKK